MAYFQIKNPDLGNFLGSCNRKCRYTIYDHLVYFTAVRYILWPFGILNGYLVYIFFPFWYMLYQEKSGNPADDTQQIEGGLLCLPAVTRLNTSAAWPKRETS
jgi:hypothetical protein